MKFQENQKVKVIARKNGNFFKIGEVVTIVSCDKDGTDYLAVNEAGEDWYIQDDEIEEAE